MVTLKPPGLRATSHAAPTVRRVATIVLAAFVAAVMTGGTQSQASPFAPQVNTAQGEVVGLLDDQIAKFLGIPYAAPPIGDLRLAPPQAHTDWATPLQATQYGNPCPQTPRLGSGSSNEDCLFLNVYTPAFEAPKRPVLVFIHGGSFNAGNGGVTVGSPSYDGGDISRKSGAVIVTMNYRLSILGFLANAGLDKDNGRPSGNYGIQDQQQALRWVQENIASFGGDPDNVTIFGESAGGISVLYHLVSPDSAGLFKRAIVESSNDGASLSLGVAETAYAPIISQLGCDPANDTVACLRGLPVDAILKLEARGLNAGPILDGQTVPGLPTALLKAGTFNHVPVIAGTNGNEGTYFIAVATNGIHAGTALTEAEVTDTVTTDFPAAATQILAAYPLASYATPAQALAAIETDSFFACPTDNVRKLISSYAPVWGYEFNQPNPVRNFPIPSAPGLMMGDSHTTELAYVFGHDGAGKPLAGPDEQLSNAIIGYWTSLAAFGNPNRGDDDFAPFTGPTLGDKDWPMWRRINYWQSRIQSLESPIREETDFATKHQCALWSSLGYPEVLITSVPTH